MMSGSSSFFCLLLDLVGLLRNVTGSSGNESSRVASYWSANIKCFDDYADLWRRQ